MDDNGLGSTFDFGNQNLATEGGVYTEHRKGKPVARFYTEALLNKAKSSIEGRPIYEDVLHIKLFKKGGGIHKERCLTDKERKFWIEQYPQEYEAFSKNQNIISGTPLHTFPHPINTPAMVANLQALNIFSVEDLAGCVDATLEKIGAGARDLREAARAYLGGAEKSAQFEAMKRENDQLKKRLDALEAKSNDTKPSKKKVKDVDSDSTSERQ